MTSVCGLIDVHSNPTPKLTEATPTLPGARDRFLVFTKAGLDLFEASWEDFVKIPSRSSAEPAERGER